MLYLGLDVGTTGAKAAVIDREGKVLSRGYREYELIFPGENRVEQNAEDWWRASKDAVAEALGKLPDPGEIGALSLSTQGATMLPVDRRGDPLRLALTWMDGRASREAKELSDSLGADAIYRKSGWRPGAELDAAKLLWLRRHEPRLFRDAAYFVSTLEFMNLRLTGRVAADPTNAAIRQIFDIGSGAYDPAILDAIGLGSDRLPEVLPVGAPLGTLLPEAAAAFGLSPHVRVYNGAHDQYCTSLGVGAVHEGDLLLATGTAWVVLGVTGKPLYTPSYLAPGIHPVPGLWGAIASLASAGSVLKWYKRVIGDDFAVMDREAGTRLDSSRGLFFFPYLAGAGFPHGMPELKGTLTGLDLRCDKYDVARALMEGVGFETALTLDEFRKAGVPIRRMTMTGGASRSRFWCELLGYITGCEILISREADAAAAGAALIAAVSDGCFRDYGEAAKRIETRPLALPDSALFAYYAEKGRKYRALLPRAQEMGRPPESL